jgi:predicted DNA-binding transcriptional regulator YafY
VDPAGRLLRLLSLLQDRPERSAADLAEHLHVTTRTVRRDVTRLRQLGYPVATTPGHLGYTLGSDGKLPPLLLEDEEAFAIAHGLRLCAAAPVGGVEDAALSALRKLDQVLPPRVRERVRAIDAATIHADASAPPTVSVDNLLLLASACRNQERVTFTYVDFHGAVSDRRAEPVKLVYVDHRWYLVANDVDRRDWRTFRVDRLTSASRTGHTFEHVDVPDAMRRVIDGIRATGRPFSARVLVDVEPCDAKRRYSTFADIEKVDDGRSILHMNADSLAQIARSIASMSCSWKILEPAELQAEVATHAARIRRLAR